MFLISKLGMLPVLNFGSDDAEGRGAAADLRRRAARRSYCLSEADAGSDVASMTTRAVRDGDDWVINGTKCWITNAGISDLYTVFARTSDDRHKGITVLPRRRPSGACTSTSSSTSSASRARRPVSSDSTDVPGARLHGASARSAQGFAVAMHTLDRIRPTIGAQAVGIAQGALDFAIGYMKERTTFGRPLADNQGLQWMAADCAMRIEAARSDGVPGVRDGRRRRSDGELGMAGAMAKCFASDVAMQVTTDCVQFLGGYGYTTEFPVERMMRDAKITQIYEGTNQIQRIVIAKKLFA